MKEKNRDRNLLWLLDFKVEKLFQPDQGVALPGEVAPIIIASSIENIEPSTSTCSAGPSASVAFEDTQFAACQAHTEATDNSDQSIVITTTRDSSNLNNQQQVAFTPDPIPSSPLLSVNETGQIPDQNPSCLSSNNDVDAVILEQSNRVTPLQSLPDSFTVTADSSNLPVNEFDLLIQSVIREEMVGTYCEEEVIMPERIENESKRIKLSNNGSRASSEEREKTIGHGLIDDPGKPRCTYTELIEKALTETGGLTVSEIYSWIS